MWNLEKWYQWICLQDRNRDTDIESRLVDTVWEGEGETARECSTDTSTLSATQSLRRVWLCHPMNRSMQASLSITNSRSSPKPTSIESVMPSKHLILCHPLFLLSPIPPSIRVFSNESTLLMRWPKYWSFSFSMIPSKEHPGLISFRMDWLDLLAVHGTLKSFLQYYSSKPSILQHSPFLLHDPTLTSIHDYGKYHSFD